MLPVYMANNCATLFGGGKPIDRGRNFSDGRRILGDHKTIRGFTLGVIGGVLTGLAEALAAPLLTPYIGPLAGGDGFMQISALALVALSFGALSGDLVKSFFKRRLNIASGAMLPVADQLDFVLGAWVLTVLVTPAWFFANFTTGVLACALLMTFPIQLFHNLIAVGLGKKKVPW